MDLHSGMPYWLALNPLYNYYHPVNKNISTKVVVIGSGITGALVAHELCEAGMQCVVIDKRSIGTGSSVASTSQLQYEIDTPLYELVDLVGTEDAVEAYKGCLESVTDLEKVFKKIKKNPDFERIPTYLYAPTKTAAKQLEKEYQIRKKHGLPVEHLSKSQLKKELGIDGFSGLYNDTSAQLDCYKAATYLLEYHLQKKELALYSHTKIKTYKRKKDGYLLKTEDGFEINCEHVVIAAGFEAGQFLPEKVMDLLSTYAIISHPIAEEKLWNKKALIWEKRDPYLYMRTTPDHRIIVGGEDDDYEDPDYRDDQLRDKAKILERKFKKLFPDIPFVTDMSWAGTFSATEDGLPLIGQWKGKPNMHFALGYGGNGITFSMIAAQVITNTIQGIADDRERLFGFNRLNK